MAKFIDKLDHAMRSCDLQNFNYSSFVVENHHRYGLSKKFNAFELTITMTPKSNFREGEAEQQRALNCPNVNCFHFLLCV